MKKEIPRTAIIIEAIVVAAAVIIGVVVVVTQVIIPTTTTTMEQPQPQQQQQQEQTQQQLSPEEQQQQQQQLEQAKQQDPEFARFIPMMTECAGSIVNERFGVLEPGQPSTALCMQEIQRGLQAWCGPINTPNYHQVKCDTVHGAQEAFDLVLR
jgi:predicted metalloprotease